jgi:hypothetical protein
MNLSAPSVHDLDARSEIPGAVRVSVSVTGYSASARQETSLFSRRSAVTVDRHTRSLRPPQRIHSRKSCLAHFHLARP